MLVQTHRDSENGTNPAMDSQVGPAPRLGIVLIRPNSSLRVLVLRGDVNAHCVASDGIALVAGPPPPCSVPVDLPVSAAQTSGARYRDEESGVELRCLVPGGGPLTTDGRVMRICS
jgi:hypothetical protein